MRRYKSSSVHVPVSTCPGIKRLLADGFRLNEVAMAQRKELVLLVMQMAQQFTNQVAFPLIHLGCPDNDVDLGSSSRKEAERPRLLRRLSSKRDLGKGESRKRTNSSSVDSRRCQGKDLNRNASSGNGGGGGDGGGGAVPGEKARPKCLGVLYAPRKDMTIISCHISPDLSQTAVMFYSLSSSTGMFCYTLHCYSNLGLQQENDSAPKDRPPQPSAQTSLEKGASQLPEQRTPHLVQVIKLSREVQPYFVYDPRYGFSRIAVANYECRDTGIAHELVVLNLSGAADEEAARVVKRGKLSLPALFGNSRFNLLYSKDGELIILQKLTDDRFGVTSFCDIYIFNSDDLTLIKYMTAALPGLFHICKVSYEPVFSRCGSFMRLLDHRIPNGNGDGEEMEECTVVQIYQLPRSLNLMSQCRRVILQQLSVCHCLDTLPLPLRLKDYLAFGPIYWGCTLLSFEFRHLSSKVGHS